MLDVRRDVQLSIVQEAIPLSGEVLGELGCMDHQQGFIEEVVRSGGVCEHDQVMNLYQTNPDLERYSD